MTDRVGQQLGNYRLLNLIGRGNNAEVYLGEHQHLNTQAAIKVLNTHFTSEDKDRFYAEARTIARLTHPHIVSILDFDVEDGFPFLIMEYAPNGTLRQRHPKGTRVALEIVVSYIKQVAGALQYIHEQKLIHRDVKPENMILRRNNEVLLAEFGIAIIAQSTRSAQARQPQEVAKSVIYMAPEQLMGKPRPASDQYALAVVTYEWLSGDPPFNGSVQQIASQHLSTPPPSLHAEMPWISSTVESIVLKALAKDPQQRFATVQDFAQALEENFKAESTERTLFVPSSEQRAESGQSQSAKQNFPSGTVTMLFTDIEGSTHLLQRLGESYTDVLGECRQLLRATFQEWNGREVDTQGDAFFIAFARATDAVLASVDAQRALSAHHWPEGVAVGVRMGLHTGEPTLTHEGYIGLDVHRAARIMNAGHGGQVLLSQATANLVEQDLPDDVTLRELGEYHLKDLARPKHLFQLVISGLPADFPPLKTLDTYPNNLPVQLTPFIGREQELEAILHMMRREDVRLLTLTGPGGAGKTRLGLQVAAELSDFFVDGVFFVNLAPISDSTLVVPTVAETLGIQERADPFLLKRLKDLLSQKQMLLLLDNFEQVIDASVQIVGLLAACPMLKILVTSREALHVQAEHEFPVPPLELPDPKRLSDLTALSHNAAVALFLQRAQSVKPDFQLTNANARAIVEICVRLDGLPLAIELAAARMKLLPPQALLARLDQRLSVLTGVSRDLPARQQTLRNTIAWSYNLLNAAEQGLFRRLSVFVGGFTLEAVEAVCKMLGDEPMHVLEGVASLLDKNLVQQTGQEQEEEPRFVLLETIREYGLERLTVNGEMEATQQAHAEYYLALAEQAQTHLQGTEQTRWFARQEQEHENLRAALAYLLEGACMEGREQSERALRLCVALFPFWYNRGYFREGSTFLERALAMQEGVNTSLRARVLYNLGFLLWDLDDPERVEALTEESLTLYRELGETAGVARALTLLGAVAWRRSQYAVARTLDEEAAALFQQVGDTWGRGRCLTDLARIATEQGEYDRARALLEESLALYQALGDQQRIGWVLCLLGRVLFESQSDLSKASTLVEQSLALQGKVGAKYFTFEPLRLLAEIRLAQGEQTRAHELAEECVAVIREVGIGGEDTTAHICLARVVASQGDYAAAHTLYQKSLALLHKLGGKERIATCLEGLGAVVLAQGSVEAPLVGARWAAQLGGAAETLRQRIGTPLPPVYRTDYEQSMAAARSALGEKAFVAAWAEGQAMTPEQALAAQGQPVRTSPILPTRPAAAYPDGLTVREVEVLRQLAQGMTDAQIAEQLVISPRTVNNHLTSIYQKIQVSSRSAATRYAIDHGLD